MSDSKQSKLEQLRLEREEINQQLEELKNKTIRERIKEYAKDWWWKHTISCYIVCPPLFPDSPEKALKKRLREIDKQEQDLLHENDSKKGKKKS